MRLPTQLGDRARGRLVALLILGLSLGAAHHIEHTVRDVVGWPLSGEVNPFTFSLAIYPAVLGGLYLFARRLVGPLFWTVLTGAGAVVVGFIHLTPFGDEPPREVIDAYESSLAGVVAFAVVVALVATLASAALYAVVLWRDERLERRGVPQKS